MLQENLEIVRRAMIALTERDLEAGIEYSAADVEQLLPQDDIRFEVQGIRAANDRVYQRHREPLEAAGLSE